MSKGTVFIKPEEIMPLFGELFTRANIKKLLQECDPGRTMYWRILTPIIILWGLIYQRINKDHSLDSYIAYLQSGGSDLLDKDDPHAVSLSKRLKSNNSSSYAQGRQRIPEKLLSKAVGMVSREASQVAGERGKWRGLAVRLLDGTSFRLPAEEEFISTYGQHTNKKGISHCVTVRGVLACDWFTQAVVGVVVTKFKSSESDIVPALLAQDETTGSLYIGDIGFGIYRVVQAMVAHQQDVLFRVQPVRALALLKRQPGGYIPLKNGESREVIWGKSKHDTPFSEWEAAPIKGRLIYIQVSQGGFKPFDLYLFTTLMDTESFTVADLCHLYSDRWKVEVHFRHIKTSLEMHMFHVKTDAMFKKELFAGILTYNFICIITTRAALSANLWPHQLGFKQCMRRINIFLNHGVPAWVAEEGQAISHLLEQLASCRLPVSKNKVKHEPRAIRPKPNSKYPILHGDRNTARKNHLAKIQSSEKRVKNSKS